MRDRGVLAYSAQSPLPLSGKAQVSRWYAGPGNEVVEVDDRFTRFTKKNAGSTWDHVCLPPVQFQIDQHPTAEFEVREATHAWQFVAVVKGRSGPALYVSPWQTGPSKLRVDLRALYRQKGYDHRFAEMVFFVAVWTQDPKAQAAVVFRLALSGAEVVVPTLPVIRTTARAKAEGVPSTRSCSIGRPSGWARTRWRSQYRSARFNQAGRDQSGNLEGRRAQRAARRASGRTARDLEGRSQNRPSRG